LNTLFGTFRLELPIKMSKKRRKENSETRVTTTGLTTSKGLAIDIVT